MPHNQTPYLLLTPSNKDNPDVDVGASFNYKSVTAEFVKIQCQGFRKTCLYCGTVYFASRSTAKYCTSTCRGYANQAKNLNEAAPWDETEHTIDALLSQVAMLKGHLQHYVLENQTLKNKIIELENRVGATL